MPAIIDRIDETGEDDFAAILVADLHLERSGKYEINVVGGIARIQHHCVTRDGTQHGHTH